LDYPEKKYGSVKMIGRLARGTYVLVVATMVTAWVVSFTREAPADPQQPPAAEQTWYIFA
jgi:hypothetical protein